MGPTADVALVDTLAGDVAAATWAVPRHHPSWRHIFIGCHVSPQFLTMCRHSFSPRVITVLCHVVAYKVYLFSSQNMAIFIMKITSLSSQNVHRKHHWFLIFITKVHRPLHITDHRTCHLHHHHKSTQTIAHNRSLNLPSSSQVTEVQHIIIDPKSTATQLT